MKEKLDRIVAVGPLVSEKRRLVLRETETGLSTGTLGPVQQGKPMVEGAELLDIDYKTGCVTVLYRHGPAQVATKAYRNGWDAVFGKEKE
jgi:hypothetical protein